MKLVEDVVTSPVEHCMTSLHLSGNSGLILSLRHIDLSSITFFMLSRPLYGPRDLQNVCTCMCVKLLKIAMLFCHFSSDFRFFWKSILCYWNMFLFPYYLRCCQLDFKLYVFGSCQYTIRCKGTFLLFIRSWCQLFLIIKASILLS